MNLNPCKTFRDEPFHLWSTPELLRLVGSLICRVEKLEAEVKACRMEREVLSIVQSQPTFSTVSPATANPVKLQQPQPNQTDSNSLTPCTLPIPWPPVGCFSLLEKPILSPKILQEPKMDTSLIPTDIKFTPPNDMKFANPNIKSDTDESVENAFPTLTMATPSPVQSPSPPFQRQPSMAMATEKKFLCKLCKKSFKTYRQLYFHNYTVHSTRRHFCGCGKSFKQACHLKRHLRTLKCPAARKGLDALEASKKKLKKKSAAALKKKTAPALKTELGLPKSGLDLLIQASRLASES